MFTTYNSWLQSNLTKFSLFTWGKGVTFSPQYEESAPGKWDFRSRFAAERFINLPYPWSDHRDDTRGTCVVFLARGIGAPPVGLVCLVRSNPPASFLIMLRCVGSRVFLRLFFALTAAHSNWSMAHHLHLYLVPTVRPSVPGIIQRDVVRYYYGSFTVVPL